MTQYICPLCTGTGSQRFVGPGGDTVRPCSDCSGTGRLTVESVRDIRPQYYDIGTAIGRCGKEGYVVRDGAIILVSPGYDELPLTAV